MSVENAVLENMKKLPAEQRKEVLNFSEFLVQKTAPKTPRRLLKGALTHLNFQITDEDIHKARREMWRGYMKEDFEQ